MRCGYQKAVPLICAVMLRITAMFGFKKFFKKGKLSFNVNDNLEAAEQKIRKECQDDVQLANELRVLAKSICSAHPEAAVKLMEESNALVPKISKSKWIMFRLYELGKIRECKKYFDEILYYTLKRNSEINKFNRIFRDIVNGDSYGRKLSLDRDLEKYRALWRSEAKLNGESVKTDSEYEDKKKSYGVQASVLKEELARISGILKTKEIVVNDFMRCFDNDVNSLDALKAHFLTYSKYEKSSGEIKNALNIKQLFHVINDNNIIEFLNGRHSQIADLNQDTGDGRSSHDYEKLNIDRIKRINSSNGSRVFTKTDIRVGIICDEFYWDSVRGCADFVYLTPQNYKDKIKEIDVLLFVSTWNGLNKEWVGVASVNAASRLGKIALEIITECNNLGIDTVFYSKEDPTNYELFVEYARHCSHVLTTDRDCLAKYRTDAPDAKSYGVIQFGINPQEHNPIGIRNQNRKEVIFSGSWMQKYPERCEDIRNIFNGIVDSNYTLSIIDRFFGQYDGKYSYPEEYNEYIYRGIEHKTLQKVHKLTPWSVNVNTVKYSPTMFANRVFELQANGSVLLSNYSMGVNSTLPTVFTVFSASEVPLILHSFTDEELYERRITGIRTVYKKHTCYDRLKEILDCCSLGKNIETNVSVLIIGDGSEKFMDNFNRQTYPDRDWCRFSELTPEILSGHKIITFFSDDDFYEEFYLEDMVNAFKYTDCDFVTKSSYYDGNLKLHEGVEHDYVTDFSDYDRTLFWIGSYETDDILSKNLRSSRKGYSVDHFNYIENFANRHVMYNGGTRDYKLSVILPVYNNGLFLYGKAFASLRRLSVFNDTEIVIVDDGSADTETPAIINYLARHYGNVKTYFFGKGGSGSASRPRNQGLSMASADYVLFFDPDDECLNDAYSQMLQKAMNGDADLVIGDNLRAGDKIIKSGNYKNILSGFSEDTFTCDNGLLISDIDYRTARIQSMIIKTELARKLRFIPGAIGEDTLYSWQIMKLCRKISVCDLCTHVYYAAREDSETNRINPSMFRKLSLVQPEKIAWLKANGLMEDYSGKRFEGYVTSWLFKLLRKSSDDDFEENMRLVYGMITPYMKYYNAVDSDVSRFYALCRDGEPEKAKELIMSCEA